MAYKAHQFGSKPRTDDVRIQEDITFRAMLLPDPILEGLYSCGFNRPSPIQLRAIPLARCGFDLIVHAKSGTGKTCVFTVAALDMVLTEVKTLQVLVLTPTREICLQVKDVIEGIGCKFPGLRVECFIGGRPVDIDKDNLKKGCHIAVGTLGRVKQLMDKGYMKTSHVRLLILDEFDKLMDKENHEDINSIYARLPQSKQILVCSATYTKAMGNFVKLYMTMGTHITPDGDVSSVLLGIRQFVCVIPHHLNKLARTQMQEKQLFKILSSVSFDQCFVFTNYQTRAESICKMLCSKGWSADWISGMQEQSARTAAMRNMKEQKVRVLVTTDITARGIDAYNVNLIINLDVPYDHTTYLHRMGRAGRFGSYGMVITILTEGEQVDSFRKLLGRIGGCQMSVNVIPSSKESDFDLWKDDLSRFEKIFGVEDTTDSKSEENKDSIIRGEDSLDNSAANKCTFPSHIKCSDICIESSNCLFVTNMSCKFIQQECDEIIYYDKIPLNVPLAIVGEKLVRLNKFPFDTQILRPRETEKLASLVSDKLFVKDEEKMFKLKDFSEIERSYNEFLDNENDSTDSLSGNTKDKEDNENKEVAEENEVFNDLSDTVNDILLSVIQKDEKTKNICKLVNCFDLLTWTIIDKDATIINNIQQQPSLTIIEFKTEICEIMDTENHIRVVKYENLESFLLSVSLAEDIELPAHKQVQMISISNICSDIALNNVIDASKYLIDLHTSAENVKSPATVFEEEEEEEAASESQEKTNNISQSSEEPVENTSSNKINDINDTTVGKQDSSSVDEKNSKKIKRKDGFGRNAKHISEMYPNADIEEDKSFPNMCDKSSTSEGEEKVMPEKKAEYKRKAKRRRPPRTDKKQELKNDLNDDTSTVERNDHQSVLVWRECNNNKGEVDNTSPTRSDSKKKLDIVEEEEHGTHKKTNGNLSVQVDYMKQNLNYSTSRKQHRSVGACSDRNVHKERIINQNLKRNKEKVSPVSDESSENRLNMKRKSATRKMKRTATIHNYNSGHDDDTCHQFCPPPSQQQQYQYCQNHFPQPPLYFPDQQQWASLYSEQQWSEASYRWYHMWQRQIRTISQYVEYSTFISNILQRN